MSEKEAHEEQRGFLRCLNMYNNIYLFFSLEEIRTGMYLASLVAAIVLQRFGFR